MIPTTPQRPEDEASWAEELDRLLRSLPDRRAPESLAPGVLRTLEARLGRRWYQRTWWQWPRFIQCLSLIMAMAIVGLGLWLASRAGGVSWGATVGGVIAGWLEPFRPLVSTASALVSATGALSQKLGGFVALGILAFCLPMYLSCVGIGTVFHRVVMARKVQ